MNARYIDEPHGITTIDAQYIKPGIASLQLLVQDGHAALFDTGTTRTLPHVLEVLQQKGLTAADVDYVVPTHVHLDHAGGAGAMMQAFPRATLIIHPRGAAHMADPGKLWEGTVKVYGEQAARDLYGEIVPVDEDRMLVAQDMMELDFHGRQLLFLDTPGHARHHFCVVDRSRGIVFAGDTMGISYRMFDGPNGPFLFPTSSPVQFEPDALHSSIDRIMGYNPAHVYLTHFGKIVPTEELIDGLHRQIRRFVAIADECIAGGAPRMDLHQRIADYMLAQAKLHGVPLPDDEIRAGLNMDARLNADGIAIWLSRIQKNKTKQPNFSDTE